MENNVVRREKGSDLMVFSICLGLITITIIIYYYCYHYYYYYYYYYYYPHFFLKK